MNVEFSFEKLARELEKSPDHRVLRRISKRKFFNEGSSTNLRRGVVIDVETTGLELGLECIIELGMIVFEYSADGRIFQIVEEFGEFENPGKPIPSEITQLTGITDEHVKGKIISDKKVEEIVKDSVLVIAHNAAFDRPFVERRFPVFKDKYWACSQTQIPWKREGITGLKLEYLATFFGCFYEAHRASDDCWAVLHILSQILPKSGEIALKVLLKTARESSYCIEATGAPFDAKDILKGRSYRWDGAAKVWTKEIYEIDLEAEERFLANEVYKGKGIHSKKILNAMTRFSKR